MTRKTRGAQRIADSNERKYYEMVDDIEFIDISLVREGGMPMKRPEPDVRTTVELFRHGLISQKEAV